MKISYIDIIILLPVIWFVIRGFKKGLIFEAASLLALFAGIYGAIKFSSLFNDLIHQHTSWQSEYIPVISFAITFIIVVVGVHLIAGLLNKLAKAVALGFVIRILGAVFGAAKIILILSALFLIIEKFDTKSTLVSENMKARSLLYNPVRKVVPSILAFFGSEDILLFENKISELKQEITTFH